MHARIIADLSNDEPIDVVVQLQARQVTLIAQVLAEQRSVRSGQNHVELATAFRSIRRMLEADAVADEL